MTGLDRNAPVRADILRGGRLTMMAAALAVLVLSTGASSAEPFNLECTYTSPAWKTDHFEIDLAGAKVTAFDSKILGVDAFETDGKTVQWDEFGFEKYGTTRLHFVLNLVTLALKMTGTRKVDRFGDEGSEDGQANCARVLPNAGFR